MCDTREPLQSPLSSFFINSIRYAKISKIWTKQCLPWHFIPSIVLNTNNFCETYFRFSVLSPQTLLSAVECHRICQQPQKMVENRKSSFDDISLKVLPSPTQNTIACLISSDSLHSLLIESAITFNLLYPKLVFFSVNYINPSSFPREKINTNWPPNHRHRVFCSINFHE